MNVKSLETLLFYDLHATGKIPRLGDQELYGFATHLKKLSKDSVVFRQPKGRFRRAEDELLRIDREDPCLGMDAKRAKG